MNPSALLSAGAAESLEGAAGALRSLHELGLQDAQYAAALQRQLLECVRRQANAGGPSALLGAHVPENDRVRHERSTPMEVIEWVLTYDQLDVLALASFELLSRRVHLLEEAYTANPKNPRFDGERVLSRAWAPHSCGCTPEGADAGVGDEGAAAERGEVGGGAASGGNRGGGGGGLGEGRRR